MKTRKEMTETELIGAAKQYDDLYNEGYSDSYNPYRDELETRSIQSNQSDIRPSAGVTIINHALTATHNGAVASDDSDYVWFRCSDYNLPDNTSGKIGYHVIYRPLCRDAQIKYEGHEMVTDIMMQHAREHMDIIAQSKTRN